MSLATRRFLAVCLVVAIVCLLYWPTPVSYSVAWTDFDNMVNTHGYLIVAMCVALLYLRRQDLTGPLQRAFPVAGIALALLTLAWLLAYRASFQTAHQLIFPLILWTAIYAVFGRNIARRCLFPVAFLYFALPFWGMMNGALQALTIVATQVILRLIGVPVRFEGNLVHIPEGTFAIEGGCSGLHFLVVGLAIASYYSALHRDKMRHRVALLGLVIALALLANWIRVSVIIIAGHLTDMQSYLVRVSHYGFGWAVFAGAMLIFFLIASRIPEYEHGAAAHVPPPTIDARCWPGARELVLAFLFLAAGPASAWMAINAHPAVLDARFQPPEVPGWTSTATPTNWRPVFIGADREEFRSYRRGGDSVEWYAAEYAFQQQGKKLLGYNNSIVGVGAFAVLDQGIATSRARRFAFLHLQDDQGVEWVLWYVFEVGPHVTTSGFRAQLWYGASSITKAVDARIISLRAKCDPDCTSARAELARFVDGVCDDASRFSDCRRDR